ncbi:ATP-binding protein [Methylomonas sp. AM2-LC]|uniref:sensor histidine kinase n=1 Tax=Methylomonas sp. AM2-LC TaxID=3153301 RepID=UPI0032661241
MYIFDSRTAFLIVGTLYLLLPSFTWIVLSKLRNVQVAYWCGGGVLVGSSMILGALNGIIPNWVTVFVSSVMFFIAQLFRIQTFRLDIDKPIPLNLMLLAVVVYSLIVYWLHYILENYVLRAQFNSVVVSALLFYLVSLVWRIGRNEKSENALWIGRVFVLVAIVLLIRVCFLIGKTGDAVVYQEGLIANLVMMSSLLAAVVSHFSYIGLALDRSMRREVKAAAELARDEENQRLGLQIAQLDRQRSLGELSASLSHELNQPLTAILTNAQLAKRGIHTGRFTQHQIVDCFEKIIYNTQRADKIIDRIRDFIRPMPVRNETVDVNRVVREVAELVSADLRRMNISLILSSAAEPILINGDPILLSQIVFNLFRNAIQALSHVSKREIRVFCSYENEHAMLRIQDSGSGMTAETLAKIGTPFFTTKVNGLGVGLSISIGIAKQMGGKLSFANVEARDGNGAIFVLNLPAVRKDKYDHA